MKKKYIGIVLASVFLVTLAMLYSVSLPSVVATSEIYLTCDDHSGHEDLIMYTIDPYIVVTLEHCSYGCGEFGGTLGCYPDECKEGTFCGDYEILFEYRDSETGECDDPTVYEDCGYYECAYWPGYYPYCMECGNNNDCEGRCVGQVAVDSFCSGSGYCYDDDPEYCGAPPAFCYMEAGDAECA